ncbi:MAG: hypothetical protein DRP74_07075 [Candidatus Omnitrophota bacterium]|nr:MAG: hypothetical protein DRP74_07075 [Candidatus Omnitrophota bacterium]
MQFSQIRKEIDSVNFDIVRSDDDNYFEAVILNEETPNLTSKLERFFNLSVPDTLTSEMKSVVASFGGISYGQTLYFSSQDGVFVFAMLWPWRDGIHTTVKIIQR